ncbi:hypothetical protein FPV67DRAFT_1649698 [Lyophyllum atratum]|nr:hypothetical protein FPV67DRAFT_1649698 [Lyophyllum atratum]
MYKSTFLAVLVLLGSQAFANPWPPHPGRQGVGPPSFDCANPCGNLFKVEMTLYEESALLRFRIYAQDVPNTSNCLRTFAEDDDTQAAVRCEEVSIVLEAEVDDIGVVQRNERTFLSVGNSEKIDSCDRMNDSQMDVLRYSGIGAIRDSSTVAEASCEHKARLPNEGKGESDHVFWVSPLSISSGRALSDDARNYSVQHAVTCDFTYVEVLIGRSPQIPSDIESGLSLDAGR